MDDQGRALSANTEGLPGGIALEDVFWRE